MTGTLPIGRGLRAHLAPLLGLALLGATASGCEEAKSSKADGMIEAWRKAGLTPAVFTALEDESLAPGKCQQGKVDGVSVVLCEYPDAAAARAAYEAGLGRVGESTGLPMAADALLLIVSDPDQDDPEGRKMNKIATTFRDTLVPSKPAAEKDEAAESGKAADEGAGKSAGKAGGKAAGGKASGKAAGEK
jgi:hypothetical protein